MQGIESNFFAQGHRVLAGIDEVGRGAWAGPVAVGVVMATSADIVHFPEGIKDSKLLSPSTREKLVPKIERSCFGFGVGFADNSECDLLGMTKAQALATERAIAKTGIQPDLILLDGKFNFSEFENVVTIIRGDSKSLLIAAASVVAKVTRDNLMIAYEKEFPQYGFASNKGYPSLQHRCVVEEIGLSSIHRKSWKVVGI
jgi:ribonuclease HII